MTDLAPEVTRLIAAADAAASEIVRPADWVGLTPATIVAIHASVRAGYTQGRLDQATEHADRLLRESAERSQKLSAEAEQLAAELAKPAVSMSDITVVCPSCGATSNRLVPSTQYPDLHTVVARCSRCSSM